MTGWLRLLPYLGSAALVGLLAWGLHDHGYRRGQEEVQARWAAQQEQDRRAVEALKAEYDRREAQHRAENTRITHELAEAEKAHDVALADQRSEFERRLRDSDRRASHYQRQAAGGASQCGNLASHAAGLDRSLEEGRRLVEDLRRTLEFRDEQLRQLGRQLANDRALLNTLPEIPEFPQTDGLR